MAIQGLRDLENIARYNLLVNSGLLIINIAIFIIFAIFASQSTELKNLIVTGVKVEKQLNERTLAATSSIHNMATRSESFMDSHPSFFSLIDNFMTAIETNNNNGGGVSKESQINDLKEFLKIIKSFPIIFNSTSNLIDSFTKTSNLTSSIEERILELIRK